MVSPGSDLALEHSPVFSWTEVARMGGAGSAVGEFYVDQGLSVSLLSLCLPDRFEAHGKPEAMLERVGLDARGITAAILERLS